MNRKTNFNDDLWIYGLANVIVEGFLKDREG